MGQINQSEPVYGKEEIGAVRSYLESGGWLMEFKETRRLENMLAGFTGAKFCSVVPNGTAALFLALKAVGAGRDDEVIVPDMTMAATPDAVVLAGANPVFADIEKESLCLDLKSVERAITKRTKAVIHVSFNGRAGNLWGLKKLCRKNKICLIEDAAQSLGSFYKGRHLGTFGQIGCFSFSVHKIITTGQGGCLITNSPRLYKKIKSLKDFGRKKGGVDFYNETGWNFKFTDVQAVIGIEQMKKIKRRIIQKKKIFRFYRELLKPIKQVKLIGRDLKESTPWFMEVLVSNRRQLKDYLKSKNIGSRPIYPALHSQPAFRQWGRFAKCPRSEEISKKCLWLPSSLNLSEKDIKYICQKIQEFYEG